MAGGQIDEQRKESVLWELIMLSLPAIAGQAIEPLSQLMGTAYVGRLGKEMFLCPTNHGFII